MEDLGSAEQLNNNNEEPDIASGAEEGAELNQDDGAEEENDKAKKKGPTKPASRLSVADRILRRYDRFQPNEVQHPELVLQDIRNGVI